MKVQKNTSILFRTIQQMPDTFTSYDFTQMAYKNGHPPLPLATGFNKFVKKYARNHGRWSKTWTKKTLKLQPQVEPIEIKTEQFTIQPRKKYPSREEMIAELRDEGYIVCLSLGTAITYLKQKGYKVMKHIDKWEEC